MGTGNASTTCNVGCAATAPQRYNARIPGCYKTTMLRSCGAVMLRGEEKRKEEHGEKIEKVEEVVVTIGKVVVAGIVVVLVLVFLFVLVLNVVIVAVLVLVTSWRLSVAVSLLLAVVVVVVVNLTPMLWCVPLASCGSGQKNTQPLHPIMAPLVRSRCAGAAKVTNKGHGRREDDNSFCDKPRCSQ